MIMTGTEYANHIASYLVKNYGAKGLTIYREVNLGKSIIGKNRRIDIFARHQETGHVLALECKIQNSAGTADEKLPYTLQDLAAMHIPAFVVYAGKGFSEGVLHLLQSHKLAAYCFPPEDLSSNSHTVELDHIVAMTFGWWELVLRGKKPYELPQAPAQLPPALPPPETQPTAVSSESAQLEAEEPLVSL